MPAATLRWCLLIHRLPPKPLYLRAKIRRRLSRVGALPLKDAVYALPRRETCLADLTGIAEEAVAGGGEAYVCEAEFAESRVDAWLVEEFRSAREADYRALARELAGTAPVDPPAARLARARKRLEEITRIDFFEAGGRREAEKRLKSLASKPARRLPHSAAKRGRWTGKTWVTRRGLHVDRIASAWFIRRFLDAGARFRFVDPKAEPARPGEIRFDMVGGDFTHEGDRCTFETLIRRTGVADPALAPIAEIVHDVDIQDGKFGRPDAPGVERIVNGILASQPDDGARLERGSALFDQLYDSFSNRQSRFFQGGQEMRRATILTVIAAASLWGAAAAGLAQAGWEGVDQVFGAPGKDLPGEVRRYGWPRADLLVTVGGVRVEPGLALGAWAGFQKTGAGDEAITMGDLVLLEREVEPAIGELVSGGFDITAIHNHLIGETPHVIYVHFHGHGSPVALAKTLKAALAKTKTPPPGKAAAKPTAEQEKTFAKLQEALGRKGTMSGTVLQVGVPRAEPILDGGMEVPPSMSMNNPMNFQTVGAKVATTGDFVLVADEVNPVLRELHAHGIQVTALHSHMLKEAPRLFFMHFWGVDTPEKIGEGLKAALAKVATK